MSSTVPLAVAQLDQHLQRIDDVEDVLTAAWTSRRCAPVVEDAGAAGGLATQTAVELHAPHRGQIVAIRVKNRLWNRFCAASLVGGSPGRIMR
jgi:hypothetical protein